MSAIFINDYSFLEKDLSSAKKEKLYKSIELLINSISKQEYPGNISSRVFIIDVLCDNISSTTLFTVYSSKYRNDTHLDVIVSYGYNEQTGKISNVISTTQYVGTIQPFPYGNNFGVFKIGEYDITQGACSGVFPMLLNGVYYNEVFSNTLYYILPL